MPVAHSDYILAAFGEEIGLIGVAALIMLFTVIVTRGMQIALVTQDSFGKLAASGLAMTMMIQIFTVVAGISSLLPMTGLTTPFISAGGSSLMANYMLIALLVRISAASNLEQIAAPDQPASLPVAAAQELAAARAGEVPA
ncbi:Lipid II flippase FtsW [Corynebacterium choanae]|uniref:Lipid II flippase FtsW n=1 Tax=Corynebacterium choanae TaxID=1862358 RepID=A0A3G6J8X1_9CORY|nr:Lipid II flippase FtsW [Corynebacterium choanae]